MRITIDAFERHDLDVAAFDHEAHVYVGWLFISELGANAGTERFIAALKSLTAALGVPDKYHDTVTRFYLDLIARHRSGRAYETWDDFRDANPDLFDRGLLHRHYSRDLLASDRARESYVAPDLEPVDSAA